MTRGAIPARRSSDHRSEASIEDQVRLCRELIALYDAADPKRRFGPELRKGRQGRGG